MKKFIVCDKCHMAKEKSEVEHVTVKSYKGSVKRSYCHDCLLKVKRWEDNLEWKK